MIEPIIIDSFAGGGGASTGIEIALGRSPDIAINHNPAALALHAANHPQTLHISENVYRIDPLDYLRGAHVGLAWFSPDCKHFSKAKGGKPTKDRHGHVEATLDVPPFTPAHADRARQVAAFLRSYGFWDDREFVTISAGVVTYVIVDIGMRMLVPRELYRAQGLQRVPACRRRARCRQLWSPRGAKGGCGMIKYATVALKSADFRNDLTLIMPGYSSYEVKSAGFGRHAPWMGHYRDGKLARAIRGLQDHYETTSRKYLILAQAMERGRKDKGGAA